MAQSLNIFIMTSIRIWTHSLCNRLPSFNCQVYLLYMVRDSHIEDKLNLCFFLLTWYELKNISINNITNEAVSPSLSIGKVNTM